MKKISIWGGGLGVLALPFLVSAEEHQAQGILGLANTILNVLDVVVLIIMALALIFFLWGVAKFILNAGDEAEQSKGKQIMLWGIIGLFVMVAVWGLVNFISEQFDLDGSDVEAPDTLRRD